MICDTFTDCPDLLSRIVQNWIVFSYHYEFMGLSYVSLNTCPSGQAIFTPWLQGFGPHQGMTLESSFNLPYTMPAVRVVWLVLDMEQIIVNSAW